MTSVPELCIVREWRRDGQEHPDVRWDKHQSKLATTVILRSLQEASDRSRVLPMRDKKVKEYNIGPGMCFPDSITYRCGFTSEGCRDALIASFESGEFTDFMGYQVQIQLSRRDRPGVFVTSPAVFDGDDEAPVSAYIQAIIDAGLDERSLLYAERAFVAASGSRSYTGRVNYWFDPEYCLNHGNQDGTSIFYPPSQFSVTFGANNYAHHLKMIKPGFCRWCWGQPHPEGEVCKWKGLCKICKKVLKGKKSHSCLNLTDSRETVSGPRPKRAKTVHTTSGLPADAKYNAHQAGLMARLAQMQ